MAHPLAEFGFLGGSISAPETLKKTNKRINLNLGHYPYPEYEPMEFWGDASKLTALIGE